MAAEQPSLLLARVLRVLAPLVRLLVRSGVTYPALAAALKKVFLEAAQHELQRQGMAATDSALTLLSGVHRRDVRALLRGPRSLVADLPPAPSLAAEVVARWLHDERFRGADGRPRALARAAVDGFDALVASVSQDVRPRAVLDELLRLGVAEDTDAGIRLSHQGFAPRRGFEALSALFADNLHDHAAAASANLLGDANHLEQAMFVDQLSPAAVERLREAARQAWQQALPGVLDQARQHFDADQALPLSERPCRARFGVYFYSQPEP
jgi:Family of unknown function (DUF6502)